MSLSSESTANDEDAPPDKDLPFLFDKIYDGTGSSIHIPAVTIKYEQG